MDAGDGRAVNAGARCAVDADGSCTVDADENGWAKGKIEALSLDRAWTLFSPEAEARIDAPRWAHQAQRFFSMQIAIAPPKRYPSGALPLADACEIALAPPKREAGAAARVRVITVPLDRAPHARSAALAIARGPAGGGFEALILRARRLWQIDASPIEGDARAPIAAAALLASLLLAPVLPPGESVLFGVKTARERLERLGFGAGR
jgi:hypothetical protein